MRLRRGVEAVTCSPVAGFWPFLAWHRARYRIRIVERRTTGIGVWERMGSSYGCFSR